MKSKVTVALFIICLVGILAPSGAQIITTFAGNNTYTYGGDGGPASVARMNRPYGVAIDPTGNVYIADASNNRIRMVSLSGIITTFAGNGFIGYSGDGGPATAASLKYPMGVAADASGNVFVADYSNNCIRKINSAGIITTLAGTTVAGYSGDGLAATLAKLNQPSGVAVDGSGNVFIADQANERIRMINSSGIISTIAGNGIAGFTGDGGVATAGRLNMPTGVAVDGSGNIIIADQMNGRIRKVNTSGMISTIGGSSTLGYSGDGGPATSAELYQPTGVSFDAAGNIYIADMVNNRIRKINTAGIISTNTGTGAPGFSGDGGPSIVAQIYNGYGVAADISGNIYIADLNNNRIRKVNTSGIISTLAGSGVAGFGDGGPATAAVLSGPQDMAIDAAGNVFIADRDNNRIRKVNTSGIITTVAGNGLVGFSGDGGPATNASFFNPAGVAVDGAGNLYITDCSNARLRKVNTSGIITTIAGNGSPAVGTMGDGGQATNAQLAAPQTVVLDASGNIFISDANNLVRKINTSGIINTICGTHGVIGYTGDGGPASAALLSNIVVGLAFDVAGNLYVDDGGNHVIRKINTSGIISTIAGNGTAGGIGDGSPATAAELNIPIGVDADAAGNIYITDELTHTSRMVNTSGIIYRIGGNGIPGYSGDWGPATAGSMNYPSCNRVDAMGNLYISDRLNNVIRRISAGPIALAVNNVYGERGDLKVFPNPTNGNVTIACKEKVAFITITNMSGARVYTNAFNEEQVNLNISSLPAGMYFIKVNDHYIQKVVKE